jgi:zinc transport system ATP-binding protein
MLSRQSGVPADSPETAEPILEVDGLSLTFGATAVFKDLRFRIVRGTSLAIIGPNGAGKTVLFRALIGALPFQGSIRWAPGIRFGYVPQKLDLVRDVPITGGDFLRAKAAVGDIAEESMADALLSVGLSMRAAAQPIGSLSGGQFQRLLVAFALMGEPDVLMLDEPTAGVDESGQERLNELVHRLQRDRGLTVLMISHDLSVVHRHATSVLCLGPHRACFGPPRLILTPEMLHEVYGSEVAFHVHDH